MFKHIPLPKKGRKNRATPELSPAETFAEASHKVLTRLDTSVLPVLGLMNCTKSDIVVQTLFHFFTSISSSFLDQFVSYWFSAEFCLNQWISMDRFRMDAAQQTWSPWRCSIHGGTIQLLG